MEAIMKDNTSVLEADLDYAARMVIKGYGTAEQAAQACGVRLSDVQARLAREPAPGYGSQEQRYF
jgi:hypothetical protein